MKGMRSLLKRKSMNSPLAEMGGVNIGIVRKPLQPKHGVPQTVKMPKLGPLAVPMTTSSKNSLQGGMKQTGNVKNGGKAVKNGKEAKKEMGKVNMGKVKWTEKSDDAWDKKHGIKEGSKKDKALDKKRGVPEKDMPKKKKRKVSAVAKETRMLRMKMKKPAPYAI